MQSLPLSQNEAIMAAPAYEPRPIETSNVVLSPELHELTEKLAENTHDLWAIERLAQGWTFGDRRDDAAKNHPGLVPYDQLVEGEKKFDRDISLGTLKAILALGYRIDPPAASAPVAAFSPQVSPNVAAWITHLEDEGKKANLPGAKRAWSFDMDDTPELATLPKHECPVLHDALTFLQKEVYPKLQNADARAIGQRRFHKWFATCAISTGIAAILCAILQLVMAKLGWPEAKKLFGAIESGVIVVASVAIIIGFFQHFHHGWLAFRQMAERLRVLKFDSLCWQELWCNPAAWRQRVLNKVAELEKLTTHEAHEWAMKKDAVRPDLPRLPNCTVSASDVAAVAAYYRVKRLEFQQHYFEYQTARANPRSKIADWKLGLWIFAGSVVAVIAHNVLPYILGAATDAAHAAAAIPQAQAEHGGGDKMHKYYETWAIGIAALLPVIGFGLRAWLAAFETPRSRNLFRVKALALDEYIDLTSKGQAHLPQVLEAIAYGEHFFANEHREWCRLQMEAEWFV